MYVDKLRSSAGFKSSVIFAINHPEASLPIGEQKENMFVVSGSKMFDDVFRLFDNGFLKVCNHFGTGIKWPQLLPP